MGTKGKKLTSAILSVTTIGWLSGASVLAPMVALADHSTAHTIEQLQAQISALQAQLLTLSGGAASPAGQCSFSKDLTVGSRGDDVKCLQDYLTSTGHFSFSGGSTSYFGSVTRSAVSAWQAANGVSPAAGYFGPLSRAKYSSMAGAAPAPAPAPAPVPGVPGTPATVPAPSGTLKVEAGTHPAASLFPVNSARVPFTVLKLTAPADQDVTVNSVVVERTGLAQDAAFSGVLLLDENGTQVGIARTLNSLHQVTLSEAILVKKGTTRVITVGGNAQTSGGGYGGQIAYLSAVSINSSLPVSGSLPISGSGHTVNETLTIGSVTMVRGSVDPGVSQTKRVDAKGFTFSAVRVTAGSSEKVYLKSIRWNQTGSVGVADLANVKTLVDGTEYDSTVSSDGKYYTTVFPDKGLLIDKGFTKEASIKGDIVGGTLRTADFDLAKRADIGLVGETYGYGIIPPQTGSSDPTDDTAAFSSVEDPWYDAAQVTVGNGTLLVSSSSATPSQNVAINLANQPLGAFTATVQGEPISVSRIAFNVTLASEGGNDDVDDLTNVTLVDANGAVVAGPADGSASDNSNTASAGDGVITFNDTVTFPVGTNVYSLKAKYGDQIDNNVEITASTTPSSDFAGTVRGLVSGNTITPDPTSAVTFSTMTVKSGSVTISVSSVPIAQTVIAGSKRVLFTNFILDASSSGEDVRFASLPVEFNLPSSSTVLSNCALFDGDTIISDTQNPTGAASSTAMTFTGGGLVIPKGSAKTVNAKCDISSGASGNSSIGYDSGSNPAPTGVTSGQDITEGENDGEGQRMTFAAGGTLTAALDAGSPPYKNVLAGATGIELARYRFTASNEDIDLKQIALILGGIASNTPIDLVGRKVTLWDGATQLGESVFTTQDSATSSAISNFRVPKGGSKTIVVKGDLAAVTVDGPLTASGDYLRVNYSGLSPGINGSYGVGASSGSTISATGGNATSSGVRIVKAYPKFTNIALSSAEKVLVTGADRVLYKFKVEAVGNDVALYKFTFEIGSSSLQATSSLYSLYSFTDSGFSQADTGFGVGTGLINGGQCFLQGAPNAANFAVNAVRTAAGPTNPEVYPNTTTTCHAATSTYTIPLNAPRYFMLRATLASVETTAGGNNDTITVRLAGDAAWPVAHQSSGGTGVGDMGKSGSDQAGVAVGVDRGDVENDFIWSPISTTTAVTISDFDYTNGYQLDGLPSTGMSQETLQSN